MNTIYVVYKIYTQCGYTGCTYTIHVEYIHHMVYVCMAYIIHLYGIIIHIHVVYVLCISCTYKYIYIHLIWYMPYMVSLKLLRWHLTHGKKRCTKAHHAKNSCSAGLPSIFLFSSLHVSVIIWLQNGAIHCRFCLVHWVGCRMIKVWMLFKASVKPGTTHFTCCEVFSCLPTASLLAFRREANVPRGAQRLRTHLCRTAMRIPSSELPLLWFYSV